MSDTNNLPKAEDEEINTNDNHSNSSTTEEKTVELNDDQPQVTEVIDSNETIENVKTSSDETIDSNKQNDEAIAEIEESNAEDAEDEGNKDRHNLEDKAYDSMSLEALTIELENLLKNEKIQAIKSHVDTINNEFKQKYQTLLEEKKEEFITEGGNEIDFYYSSPINNRYKSAYSDYRKKLNDHYQSLEKNLKQNLANKLQIIEELKGLVNLEENINTTYKHFKDLQERWRTSGPIPRDKYNNAWNSYHHHVEMFYDFLHLNRDLRDLDFKHNLEKKLKIIERAEELTTDENISHAFRELQELHKMWKEELGPVDKKYREEIWIKFKAATKIINDKRQVYYQEVDKIHEKNLEVKLDIIERIKAINNQENKTHSILQKNIKQVEELRNAFFNAGKVPIKVNEDTWAKFKEAVRVFNRQKNTFYKEIKKEQYTNLQKKLELIKIAEDNKDNDDYEVTTELMKKIQSDWKKIGHVPRKDSDKIWKQFKSACNAYFDKLNNNRSEANKELVEAFNEKNTLLDTLKDSKPTGEKDTDIATVKDFINKWKSIGHVPNDKRYIEGKFNKSIDDFLSNLEIEKSEIEMIKFENKLEILKASENSKDLDYERSFISKKIEEIKSQINQLENNLQFFRNVDDSNPLVQDVHKNIKTHKESLKIWSHKMRKIKELY